MGIVFDFLLLYFVAIFDLGHDMEAIHGLC